MTIRHLMLPKGWITEALYEHEGKPKCSRFSGTLNRGQVEAILHAYRRKAA